MTKKNKRGQFDYQAIKKKTNWRIGLDTTYSCKEGIQPCTRKRSDYIYLDCGILIQLPQIQLRLVRLLFLIYWSYQCVKRNKPRQFAYQAITKLRTNERSEFARLKRKGNELSKIILSSPFHHVATLAGHKWLVNLFCWTSWQSQLTFEQSSAHPAIRDINKKHYQK